MKKMWAGLLTHLLLHYLKFLSGRNKAFSRLVGIVRSAVWMDLDIVETLRLYGMIVHNFQHLCALCALCG